MNKTRVEQIIKAEHLIKPDLKVINDDLERYLGNQENEIDLFEFYCYFKKIGNDKLLNNNEKIKIEYEEYNKKSLRKNLENIDRNTEWYDYLVKFLETEKIINEILESIVKRFHLDLDLKMGTDIELPKFNYLENEIKFRKNDKKYILKLNKDSIVYNDEKGRLDGITINNLITRLLKDLELDMQSGYIYNGGILYDSLIKYVNNKDKLVLQ
jgi:hypothetical protein